MTRISHGFHNDHAKLKHLLWSEAGHVFDTDADLNSHKIINLLDPTSAQDAATKAYVDIYRDMINYADSPMIVTGGELSEGTNAGTLKVAALTALLRKTDSTTGELTYVTKGEEDNISIPSADTIYYVVLNYNGGNPTVSLETNIPNKTTSIPIGKVMKDSSNTVHYISGGFRLQDGLRKLHERAKTLREIELQSGCNIGYTGTNNFTMTAGIVYAGINKIELPSFDSTTETFTYLYRDGSGGWTEVSANAIDPSHYDDGSGTLAEVANNRYSCHWVYRHVSDGHVYVLYGRGSYKLAEAETAGEPNKPDHLAAFGCLIGKIIAPKNGGSFTEIQMVTDTFFVGTKVSDHSELSNLVWSKAGHTIDTDVDFNSQKIYLDKTNLPNTFLWEDGTDPVLNFDDGDQFLYDISENQFLFKIGGTTELSLGATELKLDGVNLNVNSMTVKELDDMLFNSDTAIIQNTRVGDAYYLGIWGANIYKGGAIYLSGHNRSYMPGGVYIITTNATGDGYNILTRWHGATDTPYMEMLCDLDMKNNNINNVASIDGGGDVVEFFDRVAITKNHHQTLLMYRPVSNVGYGTGLVFRLQDSSANIHDYGAIYGVIDSSTAGSEKGYISFLVANPTLVEVVRIEYDGTLNMKGNSIKNAVISTTGTAVEGAIRWDATNHKLQVYNGSSWETVSSS